MKNFMIATAIYGGIMSVLFVAKVGPVIGLTLGVFSGILFATAMQLFISYQARKFKMKEQEYVEGENLVYSGGANLYRGKVAVGGLLMLTDDYLLFVAHGVNHNTSPQKIEIQAIEEVLPKSSLLVIPNKIGVVLQGGVEYMFVVNNRKRWIELIAQGIEVFSRGVN